MTLCIVWRPSKERDQRIDAHAPAIFLDLLEKTGYSVPCTLDYDDRDVLKAMGVVWQHMYTDAANPIEQLVELIDRHDSIDLNTAA